MKTNSILFLCGFGFFGCYAYPVRADTFSCQGEKDSVTHFIEISIGAGGVESFDYSNSTAVSGSVNNCSIDSHGAKVRVLPDGTQTFALPDDDVISVKRKGDKFEFDFSKVSIRDFCGQSSAIAKHLTMTLGGKRCSDIENFK